MKKFKIMLMAAVLSLSLLFTACGETKEDNKEKPAATETEATTKVIKDMAGREVEIPSDPQEVYASSPIGQYYLYAVNPDKLVGWVIPPNDTGKHFMDEKYASLPVLGGNHGGNKQMNPEVIAEAAPDLVVSMGPDKISQETIDSADQMQEQLGIPVVVVESSVRTMDKTFDFLGEVLNEEERCKELADYSAKQLKMISKTAEKIPEDEKVSVYYAENDDGLETEPQKSPHAVVMDMVGCVNVADVEEAGGTGRVGVSPEQIISWAPDMMIICPTTNGPLFDDETTENLYNRLKSDDKGFWADLEAVQNGNFYEIPVGPMNWADRPPSVNQLLGALWCGNLVYPDYYDYDMEETTKEFFDLFYHYDLSHEEYTTMLSHSVK